MDPAVGPVAVVVAGVLAFLLNLAATVLVLVKGLKRNESGPESAEGRAAYLKFRERTIARLRAIEEAQARRDAQCEANHDDDAAEDS